MYQRIENLCNFALLESLQAEKKAVMFFLIVLCLLLLPSVTRATCVLSEAWYCDSQLECGDKLSGSGGVGTWPVTMPGQDCVCRWQTCYSYGCPYIVCSCCTYQIPAPPPCTSGNPCCGDPKCCGDPNCGGGSAGGPPSGPGPGPTC